MTSPIQRPRKRHVFPPSTRRFPFPDLLNLLLPAEIFAVTHRLRRNARRAFPENRPLRLAVTRNQFSDAVSEAFFGFGECGDERGGGREFLGGRFFIFEFGELQNLEPVFGDGDADFVEKIVVEAGNVFGSDPISGEKEAVFVGVERVESGSGEPREPVHGRRRMKLLKWVMALKERF